MEKKTYQLIGGPHDGLEVETNGELDIRIEGLTDQLLASLKIARGGLASVPDADRVSCYRLRRDQWGVEAYVFQGWL